MRRKSFLKPESVGSAGDGEMKKDGGGRPLKIKGSEDRTGIRCREGCAASAKSTDLSRADPDESLPRVCVNAAGTS